MQFFDLAAAKGNSNIPEQEPSLSRAAINAAASAAIRQRSEPSASRGPDTKFTSNIPPSMSRAPHQNANALGHRSAPRALQPIESPDNYLSARESGSRCGEQAAHPDWKSTNQGPRRPQGLGLDRYITTSPNRLAITPHTASKQLSAFLGLPSTCGDQGFRIFNEEDNRAHRSGYQPNDQPCSQSQDRHAVPNTSQPHMNSQEISLPQAVERHENSVLANTGERLQSIPGHSGTVMSSEPKSTLADSTIRPTQDPPVEDARHMHIQQEGARQRHAERDPSLSAIPALEAANDRDVSDIPNPPKRYKRNLQVLIPNVHRVQDTSAPILPMPEPLPSPWNYTERTPQGGKPQNLLNTPSATSGAFNTSFPMPTLSAVDRLDNMPIPLTPFLDYPSDTISVSLDTPSTHGFSQGGFAVLPSPSNAGLIPLTTPTPRHGYQTLPFSSSDLGKGTNTTDDWPGGESGRHRLP